MSIKLKKKLEEFFSQYRTLHYRKNEPIIRPHDPILGINFLKKGLVKQYLISEDGTEVTIHIFKQYSFFPIMLVLGGIENSYYFEAMNAVEIWRAPVEETLEFIRNDSEILSDLTTRFAIGLNGLSKRIGNLMSENAYQRVVSLILYLGKKFGEEQEGGIVIKLPLTHKDIAAWINLTRETTSRQLKKLSRKGFISYSDRHIVIKNVKGLETDAEVAQW